MTPTAIKVIFNNFSFLHANYGTPFRFLPQDKTNFTHRLIYRRRVKVNSPNERRIGSNGWWGWSRDQECICVVHLLSGRITTHHIRGHGVTLYVFILISMFRRTFYGSRFLRCFYERIKIKTAATSQANRNKLN